MKQCNTSKNNSKLFKIICGKKNNYNFWKFVGNWAQISTYQPYAADCFEDSVRKVLGGWNKFNHFLSVDYDQPDK